MLRVMDAGQFILGAEVEQFEHEVAEYLGVRHAIGVNSGTDALVIALRASGVTTGQAVATPAFSFFATPEAIASVGAQIDFVDINEATFTMDHTTLFDDRLGAGRAVVPVHLYGRPALTAMQVAQLRQQGAVVVEDCAQSFGARYPVSTGGGDTGQATSTSPRTGAAATAAAYSFFPTKNLGGMGDGGLVTTDDDQVAEMARALRVHGSRRKYHHEQFGYNSRLDSLQAAILRVKLPHVDEWNALRRVAGHRYADLLADCDGLVLPEITAEHVVHQFTVRVARGHRDRVQQVLAGEGIQSVVYYPVALDQQPVFGGPGAGLPRSDRASQEVLSLPMWPGISAQVQAEVASAVRSALRAARGPDGG